MIGHIGFHSLPGPRYLEQWSPGGVEFGFTVFPAYRRRGFAREASLALMQWAHETHGVGSFVVTISANDLASLALAADFGFLRPGRASSGMRLDWSSRRICVQRCASRLTSSCSGPSNGIAATPRALHFIMRSRRASHGSARPLNCGVRRQKQFHQSPSRMQRVQHPTRDHACHSEGNADGTPRHHHSTAAGRASDPFNYRAHQPPAVRAWPTRLLPDLGGCGPPRPQPQRPMGHGPRRDS